MFLRFKKFLPGIAVLFIVLLYFFLDAREGGFPSCPFHTITGLLCPGCGSQRALSALLHGDVLQAFQYNLVLMLSLPILAYAAWLYLLDLMGKKKNGPTLFHSNRLIHLYLVFVLIFWVLRNLDGFEFLQPG